MHFTPELHRTTGLLYRTGSNPSTGSATGLVCLGRVWGESPVTLSNGFAAGVYACEERSLPPEGMNPKGTEMGTGGISI